MAFGQTTGSRGLYILVPLSGRADCAAVRGVARGVAELVVADDPASRTLAARKADRGQWVYLDVLRNGYAQTMVAPYAVRARPGAPVATPLAWDELGHRGMSARRCTLRSLPRRLAHREDPWAELSVARPQPDHAAPPARVPARVNLPRLQLTLLRVGAMNSPQLSRTAAGTPGRAGIGPIRFW